MKLSVVINYCTNDYRFLARGIQEAKCFAQKIVVPVCDHFFDGTPEDRLLLERAYEENPEVFFIEFAYDVKQLYTPYVKRDPTDEDWRALWHSTARYLSFIYGDEETDFFLFLDADEIVEGHKFRQWLDAKLWSDLDAMWFNSYCYGFDASQRAPHFQLTGLMARKAALSPLKILNSSERFGIYATISGPRSMEIMGCDGQPMIHHYSWVRPGIERSKKVKTWGKEHLCDWEARLRQMPQEMAGYVRVSPFFDPIASSCAPRCRTETSNVMRVTARSAFLQELNAIL